MGFAVRVSDHFRYTQVDLYNFLNGFEYYGDQIWILGDFFFLPAEASQKERQTDKDFSKKLSVTRMARCKHYNMLLQMVTEMPLLMADGSFKYLDSMQDQELESFLSYLVRYCSKKYLEDPARKPDWWGKEVEFFHNFYTGNVSLPYIKNKQMKLRTIIQSCYAYYDAIPLLIMSEQLASRGEYDFLRNPNGTCTVRVANTVTPVVVIPASNYDYDQSRVAGTIMSTGVKRQVHRGPLLKKPSLIEYDCRAIVQINDSDSDSDCMIYDISSDDETSCVTTSDDEHHENFDGEMADLDDKKKNGEVLRKGPDCVDLTVEEDEEERRKTLEAEKESLLAQFGLLRVGSEPPEQPEILFTKDLEKKSKFSLKKFSLDQVPYLVRIGTLPRRCLVSADELDERANYMDKYTRNY